jgi:hypothetical protein
VSELEEAVEKEVAVLEARNATRKQRRGTTENDSNNDNENSIADSRWEVIEQFIKKWEPKLEKWDDIMERVEFEEVLVEQPTHVKDDSGKKTEKETVLVQELLLEQKEAKPAAANPVTIGRTDGGSSSSSEGGEIETSGGEEGEVDVVDSEELNVSVDENEPVGVFESDYRPSCKQVADHLESQRIKGAGKKSSEAAKKVEASAGCSLKVNVPSKQVWDLTGIVIEGFPGYSFVTLTV